MHILQRRLFSRSWPLMDRNCGSFSPNKITSTNNSLRHVLQKNKIIFIKVLFKALSWCA